MGARLQLLDGLGDAIDALDEAIGGVERLL
jgi:hypothetical protein